MEKRKQSQFYLEINSNEKIKETLTLDYGNDEIKQHNKVIYLGSNPDDNLSREPMATKMLGPVNGRLKKKILTYALRRLLPNALPQPPHDYSHYYFPSMNDFRKGPNISFKVIVLGIISNLIREPK